MKYESNNSPDDDDQNQPVYQPAYPNQQAPNQNNRSSSNMNRIDNPYAIPENPYAYQMDSAYSNPYAYGDSVEIPPDYLNNNYLNDQSSYKNPYNTENSPKEVESVAEFDSPLQMNEDVPKRNSYSSQVIPPPPPQYIYDPDSPNCQIAEDRNSEADNNDEASNQAAFKQCGRCCLKCFCTTFTIIICIAIISSFLFR